ncbi:hypothetical protein ABZ890_29310 [Streptomyces sp. NPDC046984]|uniref:hypothetical protein n=1 Tax=Streptomyces sp. NPDC046984 TaxID=3155138 RepID=UPI00340BDED3
MDTKREMPAPTRPAREPYCESAAHLDAGLPRGHNTVLACIDLFLIINSEVGIIFEGRWRIPS